jgi:hypothetical protein
MDEHSHSSSERRRGTPAGDSGVSLRDYLEGRIDSQRQYVESRLFAQEESARRINKQVEVQLDHINQFSTQIRDRDSTYLQQQVFDQAFTDLQKWREEANVRLQDAQRNGKDIAALGARHDKFEELVLRRLEDVERQLLRVRTQLLMLGAFLTFLIAAANIAIYLIGNIL